MNNTIRTIDFGDVAIRKTFKEGRAIATIEIAGGGFAEIRLDNKTNQPFAVLFDENWNEM